MVRDYPCLLATGSFPGTSKYTRRSTPRTSHQRQSIAHVGTASPDGTCDHSSPALDNFAPGAKEPQTKPATLPGGYPKPPKARAVPPRARVVGTGVGTRTKARRNEGRRPQRRFGCQRCRFAFPFVEGRTVFEQPALGTPTNSAPWVGTVGTRRERPGRPRLANTDAKDLSDNRGGVDSRRHTLTGSKASATPSLAVVPVPVGIDKGAAVPKITIE